MKKKKKEKEGKPSGEDVSIMKGLNWSENWEFELEEDSSDERRFGRLCCEYKWFNNTSCFPFLKNNNKSKNMY
jgi:hypothetical protein